MRFKLAQEEVARLSRLLRMEYRVRELAKEVGCSRKAVHAAVRAGCPCRLDEAEQVWVVGSAFASWYAEQLAAGRQPLEAGQAYCLHCRAVVPFVPVERKVLSNGTEVRSGLCPECGTRVNRFGRGMG